MKQERILEPKPLSLAKEIKPILQMSTNYVFYNNKQVVCQMDSTALIHRLSVAPVLVFHLMTMLPHAAD